METQLLDLSRRLSAALSPGDLDKTLQQVTAAAVEVLPEVQYASISVQYADGRLETVAPTDDQLLVLDRIQYDLQEGPCYESAVETQHVTAPHLAADHRFPRYAPHAVEAGIRAQAGIRLFETRDSIGALNLYSREVGAFRDLETLGLLFAQQAGTALDYARQISNLTVALQTRQLVGQAVGIVMERFGMDEARAFAFLTRVSGEAQVKVRDIARRLVDETTGRT